MALAKAVRAFFWYFKRNMSKLKFYVVLCAVVMALGACSKPADDDSGTDQGTRFPTLTVSDTLIEAGQEGGVYEITYTLSHTIEGASIVVNKFVDWIDAVDNGSSIIVTVDANTEKEARAALINVEYRLGNEFVYSDIRVNQEASTYDYSLNAQVADCEFYGDMFGRPGSPYSYYLMISDIGWERGNAQVYCFDLFIEPHTNILSIPAGTYVLGERGKTEAGTFTPDASMYRINSSTATEYNYVEFTEGTLTVEVQDSNYSCDAVLTDANGETHHVMYEGPINFKNYYEPAPEYSSTLEEDLDADISQALVQATFEGDYYGYGAYNWYIHMYNEQWTGDSFILELCSPSDDYSAGIPDGEYAISASGDAFTAIQGYDSYPIESGSWYYCYDEEAAESGSSPLYSGKVTVTNHGDGTYTISIDCMDDNLNDQHRITGSWTGTPSMLDMSSAPAQVSDYRVRR